MVLNGGDLLLDARGVAIVLVLVFPCRRRAAVAMLGFVRVCRPVRERAQRMPHPQQETGHGEQGSRQRTETHK